MTASQASRQRFAQQQAGPDALVVRWRVGRTWRTAILCRHCDGEPSMRTALDAHLQHVHAEHPERVHAVPWRERREREHPEQQGELGAHEGPHGDRSAP